MRLWIVRVADVEFIDENGGVTPGVRLRKKRLGLQSPIICSRSPTR
jgi:hypothetical protein